jgi:hypothetical protein
VGDGKRNTQIILEALRRAKETGRAAQVCAGYELNGYRDWFLPSKDELDLMYKNLKAKGVGLFSGEAYWSSSEDYNNFAWYQYFGDGSQNYSTRNSSYSVRAVRAF